ncbi:MAG: poly-gamma-glutamate system protein [Candidatus Aminicenantales bacterium]
MKNKLAAVLFFLSALFFIGAQLIPLQRSRPLLHRMVNSSRIMAKAMAALRNCQRRQGISLNREQDPNLTGLIGQRMSSITTSLGSLEAKRTTTNPNFAALVVLLLKKAGVRDGDTIAVGASSSFPALIVAVLSAAKAMGLHPFLISSLGASQWGANRPEFNWLKMEECLLGQGIFKVKPIAVSLGGEGDCGQDMEPTGRLFLLKEIKQSGYFFLSQPDLEDNVGLRMALYRREAGQNKIKAFINIGGGWANLGLDPSVLKLKPGLVKKASLPPPQKRGVIFEMVASGIPVIHLLFIKGLSLGYGLPWDPVPLPRPGEGRIYRTAREREPAFIWLASLYLISILVVVAVKKFI